MANPAQEAIAVAHILGLATERDKNAYLNVLYHDYGWKTHQIEELERMWYASTSKLRPATINDSVLFFLRFAQEAASNVGLDAVEEYVSRYAYQLRDLDLSEFEGTRVEAVLKNLHQFLDGLPGTEVK